MSKHVLHRDWETKSAADLRKTGAHAYAEHRTTDVWLGAYAVDDDEPTLWKPGMPVPRAFIAAANEPGWTAVAHNDQFERAVEFYVMGPRYGFPIIPIPKRRCTMARALAMALPASLDGAAAALGIDMQKDPKSVASMIRMSKPRKINPDGSIVWWDEPERIENLGVYCCNDVRQEREVDKRLLPLRPFEQRLWELDAVVNDRGVQVDVKLCDAAKKIVRTTQERLDARMRKATDMAVTACSNVGQLTAFCREKGIDADSVAKDQLAILLARDDLPPDVREALELRQAGSRASVAKIDALLNGMSRDGRARGLLQFHAASTGRWGGRRFQPQNIKRPEEGVDIDQMITDVLAGDVDLIDMLYGDPLMAVANCLRGMVRAAA